MPKNERRLWKGASLTLSVLRIRNCSAQLSPRSSSIRPFSAALRRIIPTALVPRATVRHIISGRCVINCSKIKLHLYLAARSPPRAAARRGEKQVILHATWLAYTLRFEISARKWDSHACRRLDRQTNVGKKVYYHQPLFIRVRDHRNKQREPPLNWFVAAARLVFVVLPGTARR